MDLFDRGKINELSLFDALQAKREGKILLPLYQRDAVWSEGRICTLWDSLLRGFPLPSFLLVKGKDYCRNFQSGPLSARGQSTSALGEYYALLDGQQRMAAIDAISLHKANDPVLSNDTIRLWLDLDPGKKDHPLKFVYWIHACTRIFRFGFRMEASGEHDFAVLEDREILTIWNRLQDHAELREKEFYEIPLSKTRPVKAGCPVPLDALIELVDPTKPKPEELEHSVFALSKLCEDVDLFKDQQMPPEYVRVTQVAKALSRFSEYRLIFQLIDWEPDSEEDSYTLYERIGRGGVQITPRQLAVSKLMLELGREGNDAVASFQQSEKLRNLLETEDVIHASARVAFAAVTDPKGASEPETEDGKNNRDLLFLTPQRLKAIQKDDEGKWRKFIGKLQGFCEVKGENETSQLQKAFEELYTSLRYCEDNPYGLSFVQLAQPDKIEEGIAPITLHPLLYWFMECSDGKPADQHHRDEMLRWVLFTNGFTTQPKHPRLNRKAFQLTVSYRRCDFSKIK